MDLLVLQSVVVSYEGPITNFPTRVAQGLLANVRRGVCLRFSLPRNLLANPTAPFCFSQLV
jgi:hypothetical protein